MYLMRFIKYRSPKMNEINIGHLPHRDKSFMGIIDTNQVGGLEMQTRDGNWITFNPSSYKTVVFIAGEPFTVRNLLYLCPGYVWFGITKVIFKILKKIKKCFSRELGELRIHIIRRQFVCDSVLVV